FGTFSLLDRFEATPAIKIFAPFLVTVLFSRKMTNEILLGLRRGRPSLKKPAKRVALSPSKIDKLLAENQFPTILLRRRWPLRNSKNARSYFGGTPTLPEGLAWPLSGETGFPLHFLAQIYCADMPKLPSGPQLPKNGTLFFFADINEEMLWEDAPGESTKVLYTTQETRNLKAAPQPDALPYIGHELKQMSGGYNNNTLKTYPLWPVDPHIIQTYEIEAARNVPPNSTGYSAAVSERQTKQIAACLPIDGAPYAPKLISVERLSDAAMEDEIKAGQRTVPRTVFSPEKFGSMFPYSRHVANFVLGVFIDKAEQKQQSAARMIAYYKDHPPKKTSIFKEYHAEIKSAKIELEDLHVLKRLVDSAPESPPLSDDITTPFNEWVTRNFHTPNFANTINALLVDLARHAAWDTQLKAQLPYGFPASFMAQLQSMPAEAEHMIFGAKSYKTNPTGGQGIKLLQLDSDRANGFMFCDGGIIDFWISQEDLQAERFDRAYGATAGG
ncbi:MAG: DUF1963 domain-containing protein, partial [Rhodobacteraceae bacterium]|nr:DUF1963 domain-containing protein [Paracoccaceae bacterium]